MSINNIHPYYYLLSECKDVGDVLDCERFQIFRGSGVFPVYLAGSEEFAQCLRALYLMKRTLAWNSSFDDEKQMKQDFPKEVDRLQRYLEKAMLIILMPEAWAGEKLKAGLKKGRKQPKELVSLRVCIIEIINEKGMSIESRDYSAIFKKLRTYSDKHPFRYGNYKLIYDPEDEKIYQVDIDTEKERGVPIKRVYDYIDRIKQEYKRKK